MTEPLTLTLDRSRLSSFLLTQMEGIRLQPLLNEPCPGDGHRGGSKLGWVNVLWLTHRLSEGN